MEGYLQKWTNYLKGWQLRYFVLKDGILSYFNTENDSKNGDCKGSYKIFMFDIIVNKSDKTRVDLILPNENNLYLKASDYKERQKWLVALASQKAIYPSNALPSQLNDSNENTSKLLSQNENSMSGTYDSTYFLKLKQSELKLYCDLLTQQTHDLKNVVLDVKKSNSQSQMETKSDLPQNSKIDDVFDDSNIVEKISNSKLSEAFYSESGSLQTENCESNNTSHNLKKLDELSSNINITCDMLVQIVRNLVILSNTSSNVSAEAVKSLLVESESNNKNDKSDISIDLDQYKYHLYHPLYLNQNLNQYNTKSIPIADSSNSDSTSKNLPNTHPSHELIESHSPSRISVKSLPSRMKPNLKHMNSPDSFFFVNKSIKSNILQNNHNRLDMKKMSLISIRNYHIENIKETELLADPVAEQSSHYLLDTANSKFSRIKKDINNSMIKSDNETLVATPNPSIVKASETHKNSHHHHHHHHHHNHHHHHHQKNHHHQNKDLNSSFFSIIKHRFNDIVLLENNGIPTEFFLNCCSDIFSILDSFGSTAFLPVKIDVYGNINKIKQKYLLDTEKFNTLQAIVKHELDEKKTNAKNSATDALMWLRRAVWFLREFLSHFSKSNDSVMSECVHLSYQKTLKQYHNFVVRSIFSLAMRSLPTKEEFYKRLVTDHSVYLDNKEQFESQVIEQMKLSIKGIDHVINIIKDFYSKNKLDI